jgi:DNA helicase-2/ATP-dependent DNA helicase PcrA
MYNKTKGNRDTVGGWMIDLGYINEEQRQAVLTTDGPLLIIAGPGTGKTYTLVKRIAYLVMEKNVEPGSILVATFTEKAAKELLTRISNEFLDNGINININEMYIGTFHSICLRILKENAEYLEQDYKSRMMDSFEQTYLVCRNIEYFNGLQGFNKHFSSNQGTWYQAMEVCRYVNQMMEELVDVESMVGDRDEDVRLLGKMTTRYKDLLERNNVMDFSSIQTKTYNLLVSHPEVLENARGKIRYIMIDEYQDTNYIQEQLVFLLAGDRKNICVVGDDDQGLYRFRGATIRNILEFADMFEPGECKTVYLDKNYRSEKGIIQFYNKWMENPVGLNLFNWDKYRFEKHIVSDRTNHLLDTSVYVCGGESLENEQHDILAMINRLRHNNNITDLNQIAFLFRSVKSKEAVAIGEYLEENGIPVYSPRSDMFFERLEVKQLIGCFILCFQSYLMDLKKNTFNYWISDTLREYYISCVKEANTLYKSDTGLHGYISSISKEIMQLDCKTDIGMLDIFYSIVAYEPFKSYLQADLQDNVLNTRAARNLSEISRMLSRYSFLHDMHSLDKNNKINMPEEFFNVYLKYLYIDGIGEYEDEAEYAPKGCVSFMTIHQSKGLEFPVVVVGSLGSFPKRNSDPLMMTVESRFFHRPPYEPIADIKYFDFWRLYYTAFSRAQNLLILATKKEDSKYFGTYIMMLPRICDFASKVSFENIKKLNYKHIYSFTSHISVYEGCPTQYKFYKEYSFAQNKMFHTSVGSLVHATLEDMNKCVIDGNATKVNEEAINTWFELNYKSMQSETGYCLTSEQKEYALSQVIRYYQHRKDELGRVWKAEEEISLVLPEYILQGVVDLVEGDGDTVEIVDYKTGPKPDITNHPERVEHYRKQLEIYAYLIEKRYGKKVSRMHLYYTSTLNGSPIISFEWKRESVDKTISDITETVHMIEDKMFKKSVQNSYACEFCDMKYVCGKANA